MSGRKKSNQTLSWLRRYESQNVTFIEADGSWPIVWERAKGVHVWDAEGKKHLDLTAAFGVALAGHGNPRIVKAGQRQMDKLLHGMGDVHPHGLKARLARELSRLTFERWTRAQFSNARGRFGSGHGKTIFCNSGFEAVEAALKTALLATGRKGVIAFFGGYHGLGYGALNATHRDFFRTPFQSQLGQFGHFVEFPRHSSELLRIEEAINRLFRRHSIGAVLVEPVQGRGGIHVPPGKFLPLLRRLCDRHGGLLIVDEILTGFGRTGAWFACEHTKTVPDLICLGKGLTGGFPLSACVGRADLMDAAWPRSAGEALHTSTFLGHPVGCAMALAQIAEIRRRRLVAQSARMGKHLLKRLRAIRPQAGLKCSVRGIGLMAGLELAYASGQPASDAALRVVKGLLARGIIVLPEGEHSEVISLTPPLVVTATQLHRAVDVLEKVLKTTSMALAPPNYLNL